MIKKLFSLALTVLVCAGVWAADFGVDDIDKKTSSGNITCSATAAKISNGNVCTEEGDAYGSGNVIPISGAANGSPNTNYIEIKAASGYKLQSPITITGVIANNSDKKICAVLWEGEANTTSCTSFQVITAKNRKTACANTSLNIEFTGDIQTIRLYSKIYINNNNEFISSSSSSTNRGDGTNYNLTEISATASAIVSTYTVTINPNGGTTTTEGWTLSDGKYTKSGIEANASVALPTMTKTGYTLTNWTNASTSAVVSSPVTVTADLTLNANYTINPHTLTWDFGEGGATSSDNYTEGGSVDYGTEIIYPADNTMSREGYDFIGWDTDVTSMPDANLTITAVWAAAATKYDITFAKGDYAAYAAVDFPENVNASNVTLAALTTDNNYRFDGWKANIDVKETSLEGETIAAGTLIAADTKVFVTDATTFTAQWTPKYTVTFNADGDTPAPATQYVISGETAEEPEDPAKDGYVFQGWQLSGKDYDFATAVTAAITLDATWRQLFTVSYYDGETKLGEEEVVDGEAPADYATFETYYGSHATFKDWFSDEDLETKVSDMSAEAITASTSYYASFTKKYSTSINIEQLVLDNSKSYDIASALTNANITYASLNELDSLDQVKKANSNEAFLGLKIKTEGGYIEMLVKDGETLKVKFGNVAANLKLKINGVDQTDISKNIGTYEHKASGDEVIKIATSSGGTVVFKQIMINEDIKVVRPYKAVVGETTNGTASVELPRYAKGETVTVNNTPATGYALSSISVRGYKYAGTKDSVITVTGNTFSMPGSEVAITIAFAAIDYTITCKSAENGSVSAQATANYGETVALTISPDENYQLSTLTVTDANEESVTVTDGKFTMPASNVTVTATFIPVGGGSAINNTDAAVQTVKMIRNGQLIIIRDGKEFNVLGAAVK